jgi:hypothetical protein
MGTRKLFAYYKYVPKDGLLQIDCDNALGKCAPQLWNIMV